MLRTTWNSVMNRSHSHINSSVHHNLLHFQFFLLFQKRKNCIRIQQLRIFRCRCIFLKGNASHLLQINLFRFSLLCEMKIDFMWLKSIFNLISIYYLSLSTLKHFPFLMLFLHFFKLCVYSDLDTPRAINAMKIDYFLLSLMNVLTMSFISLCTITILSALPVIKASCQKKVFFFLFAFFTLLYMLCFVCSHN